MQMEDVKWAARVVTLSDQFASLTDAAEASFPTGFCRVIATREHVDAGYVLFDTGPIGQPYLYGVNYERRDGQWSEGNSGNGPGWSQVGPDPELGTATIWDVAPPGADKVRVEFESEVREDAVTQRVYLVVWWGVPCPEGSGPRATAFRINGDWVRALQRS
jgi:hypothetical protein